MSVSGKRLEYLISGYIRNAERLLLLSNNGKQRIVPGDINTLCFAFYDNQTLQIFCRVRPLLPFETKKGCTECCTIQTNSISIKDRDRTHTFTFDRIYDGQNSQETISDHLQPYVGDLFHGVNLSVFVYGQTGAGKTFTMHGPKENPGIVPRGMQDIFTRISDNQQADAPFMFEVKCCLIDVINERIADMIDNVDDSKQGELCMKQQNDDTTVQWKYMFGDADTKMEDVAWIKVRNVEDVFFLFNAARKNLINVSIHRNYCPRYHRLFLADICCKNSMDGQTEYVSRVNFIECAGSERVKKSWAAGQELKDARDINRGLAALGDVLQAIQRDDKFIPYRNSIMTQILSSYLGGDANQSVFYLNICPTAVHAFESINTLRFGSRISGRTVPALRSPAKKKK